MKHLSGLSAITQFIVGIISKGPGEEQLKRVKGLTFPSRYVYLTHSIHYLNQIPTNKYGILLG